MNIKTIFTAILFTSLSCSYGQVNFEYGYVVTLKGDTIKGSIKINSKKEIELYSKITLKNAANENKNYKPDKIKMYNVRGQFFISKVLDKEPVFMRRAALGNINFYEYQVEEVGPSGEASIRNDYYMEKEGKEVLIKVKENKFRKQLEDLMTDNKEIVAELQGKEGKKVEYDKILEVIERYNKSKE